jgi:hypothetical protein
MCLRSFAARIALFLIITPAVSAQDAESAEARLRALDTIEEPGAIPVFYSPGFKERALRLQKSLETAHAWYEQQLKIKVAVVLALVDAPTQRKVEDLRAWMYHPARSGAKLIVIRDKPNGPAPAGFDSDHSDGGILYGEHILFHDDGHILADALGVHTGNKAMQELIAGIFEVAYISSQRPEMAFRLKHLRTLSADEPAKYTSMADLDKLDGTPAMTTNNQIWYLRHLSKLADSLMLGQTLPEIVAKLQKVIPTGGSKAPSETILAALQTVWPDFSEKAGPLAKQGTSQGTDVSDSQPTNGRIAP